MEQKVHHSPEGVVQKADEQIEELVFHNVQDRLSSVLEDLKQDYGEERDQGVLITNKITHQELANLVGTTRSTITKILNKMERKNKLQIQDGYIILK